MEHWALVSGLHRDLDLYARIQNDLRTRRGVAHLFVLGDMISPDRDCIALLTRLRRQERGDQQAVELQRQNNPMALEQLWAAVKPEHLNWLASLQFGFIELDCGLIHGSSADVGDELHEATSPLILLDRLTHLDVNRLFTACSGRQFRLQLTGGQIRSRLKDHACEQLQEQPVPKRSVIGIGCGEHYTLYDPASDHTEFLSVDERSGNSGSSW